MKFILRLKLVLLSLSLTLFLLNLKISNCITNELKNKMIEEEKGTQEDLNQKENYVREINSNNLKEFIINSSSFLILFTEPNCLRCIRYTKILMELNQKFSNETNKLKEIKFATINSIENPSLLNDFKIKQVPTFLFYYKKYDLEERIIDIISADEIQILIEKKILKSWKFLDDISTIRKSISGDDVNFVVCKDGSNSKHERIFEMIFRNFEHFEMNFFYADHYLYEKLTKCMLKN
jgi:thiol-disulfide isomerase/thioredoxin